jgi:hypothetical protein
MGRQAVCDRTGDWRDTVSPVIPSAARNPCRPGRRAQVVRPERDGAATGTPGHPVLSRQSVVLSSQSRRRGQSRDSESGLRVRRLAPSVTQRPARPPSHQLILTIAIVALLAATTACDRGIDLVRQQFAKGSRATVDSLSAQNAALQRQMIVFERISAEKDTLLREVRDAHLLIEAMAEQLRRMDGSPMQLEFPDSTGMSAAMGGSDSVVAAAGEVGVDAAGEIPAGPGTYRDAMLRKLESVRRRLADVEDSSRVRGERLLESVRDNDRLREQIEEHLRTIEGQKDLIATYLVRITELETQVTALTDSTRKLTEANGVLTDSLRRITSRANTAWYVVGTRDQLVRAGVLTEEGGILGFGKSLAPSRAMARNVFTRIDRLRDTVIALPEAKQYRIMSRHDPGLVQVDVTPASGGTMRIKDPEQFWSASGWLIIVY